ncbi:MAG: hypothetical protein ACP5OP_09265, partial [Leptospirillia bacterium]
LLEKDIPKNKGLETDKAIQYSFNKHCSSSNWLIVLAKNNHTKREGQCFTYLPTDSADEAERKQDADHYYPQFRSEIQVLRLYQGPMGF